MMLRSKNDSIARYEPDEHDDREARRQDPEPDDDGQDDDEEADADGGPRLAERPPARDRRWFGLRGVTKVESRIVEMAGLQGGQPVARRRRWPCRAPPPATRRLVRRSSPIRSSADLVVR